MSGVLFDVVTFKIMVELIQVPTIRLYHANLSLMIFYKCLSLTINCVVSRIHASKKQSLGGCSNPGILHGRIS